MEAIAGPVLATVSSRVAAELIVGFGDGVSLTDGGHDLDNYLFPVAQRLGPQRVAAIFGRKIHGPSSLAVGPAQPDTAKATPQFSCGAPHLRRLSAARSRMARVTPCSGCDCGRPGATAGR